MSQLLAKVIVHIVYSTKHRQPWLRDPLLRSVDAMVRAAPLGLLVYVGRLPRVPQTLAELTFCSDVWADIGLCLRHGTARSELETGIRTHLPGPGPPGASHK